MKMKQLGWALALGGGLATTTGCTVTNCSESDAGVCEDLFDDDPIEDAATTDPDGGAADASAPADAASADDAAQSEDSSTPGASISVEAFCEQLNAKSTAWRYKFDECCPSNLENEDREYLEYFLAAHFFGGEGAIDACVSSINAAVSAGNLVYDGAYGEACAAAFVAQLPDPPATCPTGGFDLPALEATVGHGAVPHLHFPECRQALQGQVAANAEGGCDSTLECQGGLRCRSVSAERKECELAADERDVCQTTTDCADGYVCAGVDGTGGGRQCRADDDLVLTGGNCSASTECYDDFVCQAETDEGGTCRPPMSYPLCAAGT